jgi:hypothetical protein
MFNPSQGAATANDQAGAGAPQVNEWIKLARDADQRSTTYFENNYRKRWEDDLRMFQSKHPRDSKYNADAYKYRSRIFRPKSRSVVRKNEATAALAFFSNPDVMSIEAENDEDMNQIIGADVMQEVLQYRLNNTIPWFLTVIGGMQDAMTVGLVASLQCWHFRQKMEKKKVQALDPDTQEVVEVEMDVPKVTQDEPSVNLFPIENIRFDPAAHWYDVVKTSPYLILQIPMYVNDVLENMETEDKQGEKWKRLTRDQILSARIDSDNAMRMARSQNSEDEQTLSSAFNEFDVVMTHLNFIKRGDTTWAYYTLKSTHLLTEPMPVEEMFLHCKDGRPPVQIGFTVLETHKPVPTSLVGLTRELQKEANEIANQRLDNVKYVLNKRSLVRRGANVDVDSLLRNVPGGITMVNNVETDVREVNWQDVTSSSYQEQDRVNVDFDELAGNFAQSSVQTNRKLNETVGGMKMMAQGANALTEYGIHVFVVTWMLPVLKQLIKMEAAYETDEVVLALAASRAKLFPRYGVSKITDDMLNANLTMTVNVGMGATDPEARLQRFTHATQLYDGILKSGMPDADLPQFRKQIYGLAGFPNAIKFFNKQVDPALEQAKKVAATAEAEAQKMVDGQKFQLLERERKIDKREADLKMQALEMRGDIGAEVQKAAVEANIKIQESAADQQRLEAEAGQRMRIERDEAAQRAWLEAKEASQKAWIDTKQAELDRHLDQLASEQKAHNERMLAVARAEKIRTAEKKDGKWEVRERSA